MAKNYGQGLAPRLQGHEGFDFVGYLRRLLPRLIALADSGLLRVRKPPGAAGTGTARPAGGPQAAEPSAAKPSASRSDRPYPTRLHAHPLPEVVVQVAGRSVQISPEGSVELRPGDLYLIPGGTLHREEARAGSRARPCLNVVFSHYLSDFVEIHLGGEGSDGRMSVLASCHVRAHDNDRHVGNLNTLAGAVAEGGRAGRAHVKGLVLAYLCDMFRLLGQAIRQVRHENEKVGACIHLIVAHLADPDLSVQRLAAWLRCSPNYLSNIFRVSTGRRIKQVINERRVANARHLLRDARMTIKEVASASGFKAAGYFTQVFRRLTGLTPKAYRRLQ